MIPRLKNMYEKEILPKLMVKLNFKNKHQAPKVIKVVLNVGLGEDAGDAKKVKSCLEDVTAIAGQKAIVTKFKKSIANFKTRKGFAAGVKVTLRSVKMYEFIDRLVNISPIGSIKVIFFPYQLDLVIPGIFPAEAISLKAILDIFNFL